ncbi:keratin, type I cytoskeletal 13-like isoform X2 [Pygocentrus nattereri]|uniref:IF rod domain-containing protein n=1 Tax=Pygocentrus nattereri TaxID=42514 RepID=A0A3B4DPC3_PYGNA|nr:keratin, type I cytoskeletal 13-like isoform X2 [Pygocentrus nattereri]
MGRSPPSPPSSESGGSVPPQKSYSSVRSIGSGSRWIGGGGARSSYGYSLGLGLGGGVHSQVGLGLGSGIGVGIGGGRLSASVGGSRLGASFGGRLGLGLASGGDAVGGGRLELGWAAGGGVGGVARGGAGFWTGGIADGGLHPFATNEKLELQSLNDRLAIYLDKVKKLEIANRELEEKLRGFKANKVPVTYDMQAYQIQLRPLQDQLADLLKDCSRLALLIDNAKLASDDYRIKYENEVAARQAVESDVAALKAMKIEYDLATAEMAQEYQILLKDRDTIQSTHEQEVLSLRGQVAGTLTVNVQAETSVDLSHRLADLRAEYENIAERNHREIENWYAGKMATKDQQISAVTEVTVTGSAEIVASRTQILTLQTELDAALLQKNQLEQHLVEVQGQNQNQLLTLSRLAGSLEGELASVRESALQQAREYQVLLSTKMQLEKEIATYKSLLEFAGDLSKFPGYSILSSWAQSSPAPSVDLRSLSPKASPAPSVSGEGAAAAGVVASSGSGSREGAAAAGPVICD